MASVFLPELETDGIGAAILPAVVTGKNKPALLVYVRDAASNAALMRRMSTLASRENGSIAQSFNPAGFSVAVFEPGYSLSRRAWAGLGIRQYRLENARAYTDLADHSAVRDRLDTALSEIGLKEDTFRPNIIGVNRYGEQVTDGPLGRSLTRKGVTHGEWEVAPSGQPKGVVMGDAFFRGETRKDFSGCARAVAIAIGKGEKFDQSRIVAMHDLITEGAPKLREERGFRLSDLQEEIESHLASLVGPLSLRSADPRSVALKIDDAMAAHNQRSGTRMVLQQYSTPFPIGRTAAETLLPQPGESLLEPTVGNGVLVSGFVARGVQITGIELDPPRAARARTVLRTPGDNVIEGDFLKVRQNVSQKFDLLVANPPFGKLDSPLVGQDVLGRNVRLRTLHHQIVFEALRNRTDDGRAFLVLPGEMMRNGEIEGADRFFDNWLRATYHVAGSASLDGRLYRKMGTEYPVIVYAVGPRREVGLSSAEVEAVAPERHELILSHDELFAWSDRTQERMKELTGLSFVDYPDIRKATERQAPSQKQDPAPAEPTHPTSAPPTGEQQPAPAEPAPARPASAPAEPKNEDATPRAPRASRTRAPATEGNAPEDDEQPARRGRSSSGGVRAPRASAPPSPPSPAPAPAGELDDDVPEPEATIETPEPASPEEEKKPAPSLPQSTVLVDDIEDDPFVRRYEAFSTVGEARTQVQKSLQGLTYRALMDVETKHGSVDEYVASKLGMSADALFGRLSPEQVDALALNFARHDEGKGFLNADLMGVGKGRFLAGTMVAAYQEERPVIFMTEQPNLFSDMLARDVVDVTQRSIADLKGTIQPFIMNQTKEAAVRDLTNGDLIYGVGDLKLAKEKGISTDFNTILATYSQFQVASGSWKLGAIASWINQQAEMGRKPHLVLDEVHRAAGEMSATGERIEALVDQIERVGGTVTYSSATPLKSGRNIKVYRPILPELGMSADSLINLIERNPLALQEVLSSEMARMGTLISREVDSRGTTRRFIPLADIDPDRYERLVKASDAASMLLREIVGKAEEIAADAKKIAGVHNASSPENKVSVSATSPVTQFHSYCQYLLVAVKTAFAREMIATAVAQGKKPILVVENTGKELLSRMADREGELTAADGRRVNRLPDIGDILFENADKLLTLKVTDNFGGENVIRLKEYEGWLDDFKTQVSAAREIGLNELSIAPLDYLQQIGNDLGLQFGELTKRQLQAQKQEDGSFLVETRTPEDKRVVIRSFNNGDTDFIGMNRSAASGVSMHPSPATGDDLRPRVMIKLQLQSDVTQERQIDGRINRYGQVHDAEYWLPMSGFAADDRLVQLFNRKNRSLSATSTASRENASNIEEAVDLLNPVGEGVVREYLSERKELAITLGLPIPGDSSNEANVDSYARRLMGRLVMLPVEHGNTILSELDTAFRMKVEALDAQGQNPLRLRQFDWKARSQVVNVLQSGEENSEEVGKRPVNLVKLSYKEKLEAISSDRVDRLVQRGVEQAAEKGNGRALSGRELFGQIFDDRGIPDLSSRVFDKAMARRAEDKSFGMQEVDPKEALSLWHIRGNVDWEKAEVWQKRLLRAFKAAEFLDGQLDDLVPGRVVGLKREFYPRLLDASSMADMLAAKQEETGQANNEALRDMPVVLTRVAFKEEDPLNLGSWTIGVAMPGQQNLEEISLSSAFAMYDNMDEDEKRRVDPVIWKDAAETEAFTMLPELDGVQAPKAYHIDTPAPDYTNPVWKAYMDKLFDAAPSGEVTRHSFALEGNMFLAMHLTQVGGTRLGQKAIYTSETGEIRHAVILKRGESLDKLQAQISSRLEAIPTVSPYQHHKLLAAACEVYENVWKALEHPYYKEMGTILDTNNVGKPLEDKLTFLFSKGVPSEDMREYVRDNLDKIVNTIAKNMKSDSIPEVFVGADMFGEVKNLCETKVYSGKSKYKEIDILTARQAFDLKGFTSLASHITGEDAHLVLTHNHMMLLYDKKASDLIETAKANGFENILDDSSNNFAKGGGRLTKGTLCFTRPMDSSEVIASMAKTLQETAEAQKSQIQLRGPVAKAFSSMDSLASKAHEAIANKHLDAESALESEQTVAPGN